jgi:hypothetical protein
MKTVYTFIAFVLCTSVLTAQKNFVIEYDKLNDEVNYYESVWKKGEKTTSKVEEVKVAHNDIVTVRIVNVNQLAFDTEVVQAFTEEKEFNSPFAVLAATFGQGLPGLSVLGNLGSQAPSNIGGRNESEQVKMHKEKIYAILEELHTDIGAATKAYSAFERAESVIYSKTMTKDQIKDALSLALEKIENTDVSELLSNIESNNTKLEEILDEDILDYEDKAWEDIDRIDDAMSSFDDLYQDEYGDYKRISPSQSVAELESTKFTIEHTFRSKTHEGSWKKFDMNDYYFLFRDKNTGDEDTEDALVDHAKMISVKTKKNYKPHWGLGVDYVLPFSGRMDYLITSVPSGDWDMPDSLSISENGTSSMQLTLGTKLCFDIPNKSALIPTGMIGLSIGGLSNIEENFNFNVLLGAGLGFKAFPYVSINAGVSFSQLQVLKDGYRLNSTFAEPDNFDVSDPSDLFDKKFKPGLFFGLTFRL